MPVTFEKKIIGEAPVLLAAPADARDPLPAVLWFHGFQVDKEVHRPELERIAEAGFLAVGVDAAGHGERRLPDFEARLEAPPEEVLQMVIGLASRTADEVPGIVRALADDGVADPGRVAVAGVSMGGYVVYRVLVVEPRIRAAAAILGSPEWPHPDSPYPQLRSLSGTALLSITAEKDENVPPAAARRLHHELSGDPAWAGRQRYVELPGAQHLVSAEEWNTLMEETIAWLRAHTL